VALCHTRSIAGAKIEAFKVHTTQSRIYKTVKSAHIRQSRTYKTVNSANIRQSSTYKTVSTRHTRSVAGAKIEAFKVRESV